MLFGPNTKSWMEPISREKFSPNHNQRYRFYLTNTLRNMGNLLTWPFRARTLQLCGNSGMTAHCPLFAFPLKILPKMFLTLTFLSLPSFCNYGQPSFAEVPFYDLCSSEDDVKITKQVQHGLAYLEQKRRVKQLLANLKKPSPSNQLTSRHMWSVIITYKDQAQVALPETLNGIYELNFEQSTSVTLKVARLAKILETAYKNLLDKGKNAQRASHRKDFLHSAYSRTAFQHIRGHRSVPLHSTQR